MNSKRPRADKSKDASSPNLLDFFAAKRKALQSTDDDGLGMHSISYSNCSYAVHYMI